MNVIFRGRPEISARPEASRYPVDRDNKLGGERRPGGTYRGSLQCCARSRPGEDAGASAIRALLGDPACRPGSVQANGAGHDRPPA